MEIRRSKSSGTNQWNGEQFQKEDYYKPDSNEWLGMAYRREGENIEVSLETSRLPQSATEDLPVASSGLAKFKAESFEEVKKKLGERGLDVVDHRRRRLL
jgi:hypothetical protein